MSDTTSTRGASWRWWVCCLLLMATAINYMDRLTLNLLAKYILLDLDMDKNHYATIEAGFALAFALGAIVCGFIVDRWNVYWVYPLAVLAWSAAGFCSGFANGFATLLLCRVLLGVAEAANWPCALRTTQHILPPADRPMGNSILQSGAAIGAILIPLVMFWLFDEERLETWRLPFFVVGAGGTVWVVFWWASLRPSDLRLAHTQPEAAKVRSPLPSLPANVVLRRFVVLVILVVTINMTWHFLRAWGPLYLQSKHGFEARDTFRFSMAYYLFTDLGALSAGFLTLKLARGGLSVHLSRLLVFLICAMLTLLCLAVPFLPVLAPLTVQIPLFSFSTLQIWYLEFPIASPAVFLGLLIVGFGALGVFPNYYSFSQDLTVRHQGKLTGTLGCLCWLAMALWQKCIGWLVEGSGSYTVPFVISGLAPMLGFVALVSLWGKVEDVPVPLPRAEGHVGSEALREAFPEKFDSMQVPPKLTK